MCSVRSYKLVQKIWFSGIVGLMHYSSVQVILYYKCVFLCVRKVNVKYAVVFEKYNVF